MARPVARISALWHSPRERFEITLPRAWARGSDYIAIDNRAIAIVNSDNCFASLDVIIWALPTRIFTACSPDRTLVSII